MNSPSIQFCNAPGAGQIAYATRGSGPPLVLMPGWLCHVEEMWNHAAAASALELFSARHRFVWYDRIGCGLSDRVSGEPSIDDDVAQLAAVMDAAGIDRAPVIGYSFSAPSAAVFAARYPERVERLVLYAPFARGSAVTTAERLDALRQLVRVNWGLGARTLSDMIVPNGTPDVREWFTGYQRASATPEMADRLLGYLWATDVRDVLPNVQTPSLVLHNQDDRAIPLRAGQEVAALIPGATLSVLPGDQHIPFFQDAAPVVESILAFVDGRPLPPESPPPSSESLTPREREVLRLIASGASNKQIAITLHISIGTVERHVFNIYGKIAARGRADATMRAVAMGIAAPASR